VQRQLEFWPVVQGNPKRPPVWETLTPNQRMTLITRLARMIRRAVDLDTNQQIQEREHEPS
jgi:hypothetical protein